MPRIFRLLYIQIDSLDHRGHWRDNKDNTQNMFFLPCSLAKRVFSFFFCGLVGDGFLQTPKSVLPLKLICPLGKYNDTCNPFEVCSHRIDRLDSDVLLNLSLPCISYSSNSTPTHLIALVRIMFISFCLNCTSSGNNICWNYRRLHFNSYSR